MITFTDAEANKFQNIYNSHKEAMLSIITFDLSTFPQTHHKALVLAASNIAKGVERACAARAIKEVSQGRWEKEDMLRYLDDFYPSM